MYASVYNPEKKPCFQFRCENSLPFHPLLHVPSPLPFHVFFPLTGLYWNKSLVTHTAAFLWVSQANFDTLIITSLSLFGPLLFLTQTSSLFKPWPPSFPSPCTLGHAIHHCKSHLSLGDALGEGSAGPGSHQGHWPISVQRAWSEVCFPAQEPPKTGSLNTLVCSYLPPSQMCALALTSCLTSLCIFQPLSALLIPYRDSAGNAWSRQQCMAGKKKRGREGGRCLWQCGGSNEGPHDGKTISKAWTHRPLARTHAQNSEGVMGWQRPGGQSHWQTHIHRTLHGE